MTLTEAEREQLRARAKEAGVSMSRLLVESALAHVETAAERQRLLVKLNRFERLLGNLANNVNQLAHQANIAGQLVALERLTVSLDELERDARAAPGRRGGAPMTDAADRGARVIPNITRGGSTLRLLRYLAGKGRRDEHSEPHLVAGQPGTVLRRERRSGPLARAVGPIAVLLDEPMSDFGTEITVPVKEPGRARDRGAARRARVALLAGAAPRGARTRRRDVAADRRAVRRRCSALTRSTGRPRAGGSPSGTGAQPVAATTCTWS